MAETILVEILSTKIDRSFRDCKVDVATDLRYVGLLAPFGIDSHPVDGILGLLDETSMDQQHLIGIHNQDVKAEKGEVRIYSALNDNEVTPMAEVWLKNDGVLQLNGDVDHAVRYSKLEEAFNELNDKFNKLVQAFNGHIHAGNGAAPTPVLNVIPVVASSADISGAKIDTIKTP